MDHNMGEQKSKIEGWRKMGIGIAAISALTLKESLDFKTALIIGIIAVFGICCQTILDRRKK